MGGSVLRLETKMTITTKLKDSINFVLRPANCNLVTLPVRVQETSQGAPKPDNSRNRYFLYSRTCKPSMGRAQSFWFRA